MLSFFIKKCLIVILLLSSSVTSAQILGGGLCGIGAYCPPHAAPGAPWSYENIKNSPIGSTLGDYYTGSAKVSYGNMMTHFFKLQIGKVVKWEASAWGGGVVGRLTVIKLGTIQNRRVLCFQYKSDIRVYENTKVIASEEYTGAACTLQSEHVNRFIETDPNLIDWEE